MHVQEHNLLPTGTCQILNKKSGDFSVVKLVNVNYSNQSLQTYFHQQSRQYLTNLDTYRMCQWFKSKFISSWVGAPQVSVPTLVYRVLIIQQSNTEFRFVYIHSRDSDLSNAIARTSSPHECLCSTLGYLQGAVQTNGCCTNR